MKKIIYYLLCVLILCGLCACDHTEKYGIKADETTFLVNIIHHSEEDIYVIHHEYYLKDKPIGGGEVCNADGSAIEQGDILTKDFMDTDFPESGELSDFELELFVVDKDGNEYLCSPRLCLDAEYGETYTVELVGDFLNGFEIQIRS